MSATLTERSTTKRAGLLSTLDEAEKLESVKVVKREQWPDQNGPYLSSD